MRLHYPPAPWGHQAVRSTLEPSSYRLDDLSLKTDGWYLYECCFPAPRNKAVTTPDVHCLNSGVPPGSNPAPWNKAVTTSDVHCLNSGVPPGTPENPSIFKPVSRTTKAMKLVPRPPKIMKNRTWNHKKSNFCESCFLQYLPCQMLVFPIPDTQI